MRIRVNLRAAETGILHGSCPGTNVCGSAKRLECVCFSTAMVWCVNAQRTGLEKRR